MKISGQGSEQGPQVTSSLLQMRGKAEGSVLKFPLISTWAQEEAFSKPFSFAQWTLVLDRGKKVSE